MRDLCSGLGWCARGARYDLLYALGEVQLVRKYQLPLVLLDCEDERAADYNFLHGSTLQRAWGQQEPLPEEEGEVRKGQLSWSVVTFDRIPNELTWVEVGGRWSLEEI